MPVWHARGPDGTTPEACIGRPLDDLLTPPELVGIRLQLGRLSAEQPLLVDPEPRTAPDDPGIWIEWVDRLVSGPDGDEVLSVGRNVTDRHEAEMELRESEHRARLAMARAPIGMEIVSLDGHLVDVNNAFCRFVGRTRDDLIGTTWQEIAHPDDVEPDQQRIDAMVEEGRNSYEMEKRYLHADGTIRWGHLAGAYVRDLAGSIAHLGGWAWDLQTDTVVWSDVMCRILGFPTGSQMTYRQVMDLHPDDDRAVIEAAVDACLADGTPWDIEHLIRWADGELRWVRAVGEAGRDAEGRIVRL